MKLFIQDITVGDRFRKDKGDLDGLMASIKELGLLQPIGVTKDNALVFGERRLTACFALGWSDIDVRIVDVSSIIEGEFAENEMRKQFTPSERLAIAEAVEREIGRRQGTRTDIVSFAERADELRSNRAEVQAGERTKDVSAKKAGFSSRDQMRRTAKVVELGSPQLVEKMDNGEIAVSRAAELANLTQPEQVVSLQGAKSAREEREAAEAALLDEIRRYELYHPANAYTEYVKANRKRPDKETAADIGRLLGSQVKADDGTMQPPKSKAQKASERDARDTKKELGEISNQCHRVTLAVTNLAANDLDPALIASSIDQWQLPTMIENFEKAYDWFNRFAKEWHKHVEENKPDRCSQRS